MRIAIIPIGPVNEVILDGLRMSLSEVFETDVNVLKDAMPLPDGAYNPRRGQYHSSRVLSCIKAYTKAGFDRVLGVTEADLYAPGLNFVFGEAQMPGKAAIISLHRLKAEFYGVPPNRELFIERSVKEAVHEIGHTLGLRHCHNPRCVMFFSNSILDTDFKSRTFCENCQRKILKNAKKLGREKALRSSM